MSFSRYRLAGLYLLPVFPDARHKLSARQTLEPQIKAWVLKHPVGGACPSPPSFTSSLPLCLTLHQPLLSSCHHFFLVLISISCRKVMSAILWGQKLFVLITFYSLTQNILLAQKSCDTHVCHTVRQPYEGEINEVKNEEQ